jgi:hypothetical protein
LTVILLAAGGPAVALGQDPSTAGYAEAGANVLPAPPAVALAKPVARDNPATPAANSGVLGESVESGAPAAPVHHSAVAGGSSRGQTQAVAPTGAPAPVLRNSPTGAAQLPFTGKDVGQAGLAGALLMGLGLLLRSTTRAGSRRSRRSMARSA